MYYKKQLESRFRSEGGLLHLPHHAGLHFEEIVRGVFEEAVFTVVAPGGGAVGDGHVLACVVGNVGLDGGLPGTDAGN